MYHKGAKNLLGFINLIGYIYKTTNLINGKIYIGQHISAVFEPQNYIGSGSLFKKALQKYGKKSFKCEFICGADSAEELNNLERFYIDKFNALNPDIGYNLCAGGVGGNLGYKFTPDQIDKLRESHMGHKNTAEAIKKQADSLRGRIWVTNGTDRKMVTADNLDFYLQNGWIKGTGVVPYQSKAVICYETGEEFESRTAANKKYPGALKRCLLSEFWRTCAGYHWYFKGDEERKEKIKELIDNNQNLI